MQTQYPIKTSAAEVARLRMQSDLFRADADAMLEGIGVGPGWRCLDLCCGVGGITDVLSHRVGPTGKVLGADVDAAKLAVARDWALANGLQNVAFERADAFATGLPPASFDLVHCRFALSVIPNGTRVLDHMVTLARPGGIVFAQESNARTMECSPPHPAWDRLLAAMMETFARNGADVLLGPRLYAMFLARGLTELRVRPCLRALRAGDPMMMHLPATVEGMRESILALGTLAAGELDELLCRLREHLSRPDTLTISYTMVQVVGRIPAPASHGAAARADGSPQPS
ncbi:MAG: methyltransferase domain-containing protein [Pseudomonadota bacterium]